MDQPAAVFYSQLFRTSKNKRQKKKSIVKVKNVLDANVKVMKHKRMKKHQITKQPLINVAQPRHVETQNKSTLKTKVAPKAKKVILQPKLDVMMDSIGLGLNVLKWLISPVTIDEFFSDYWEKKPLLVKRNDPKYYSTLEISLSTFQEVLKTKDIFYGENLDVAIYRNGKRENLTPDECNKAHLNSAMQYLNDGCSLRLLNPQTYFKELCKLNKQLSEYFGNMVGVNMYLTPGTKSQGFAPHFDDIEAFVLQLEGSKAWKIYAPFDNLVLPRDSSGNFADNQLGDPLLSPLLQEGDFLYFPRGFVHQARSLEGDQHSLHVTISTYQNNAWIDFLENLVPAALRIAAEDDVTFREGLPLNYLSYMGLPRMNVEDNAVQQNRAIFKNKLKSLMMKLVDDFIPDLVDGAADQMGRKFIHDSLPAIPPPASDSIRIGSNDLVCLRSFHCLRLINDNEGLRVYYNIDNSSIYHSRSEQFLILESIELTEIVEQLINSYPKFIRIEHFQYDGIYEEKIRFFQLLLNIGIIVVQQ